MQTIRGLPMQSLRHPPPPPPLSSTARLSGVSPPVSMPPPPPPPPLNRPRFETQYSRPPQPSHQFKCDTSRWQCSRHTSSNHVKIDSSVVSKECWRNTFQTKQEENKFTDINAKQNESCPIVTNDKSDSNSSSTFSKKRRSAEISSFSSVRDPALPKDLTQKFGPLKCDLCSVSVNSTVQAKMHYSGKQHEKKVYAFLQQWCKETGEPMPKQFKIGLPSKKTNLSAENLFCNVCNLVLTSVQHAEQHYMGRNHQKAVANKSRSPMTQETLVIPKSEWDPTGGFGIGLAFHAHISSDPLGLSDPEAPSTSGSIKGKKFFCELCQIAATSKDQLEMHFKGAKHRKMEAANVRANNLWNAQIPAPVTPSDSILASVIRTDEGNPRTSIKDYSIYRTPTGYFYCQPCNLTLNSEAQFSQHCDSKKHKYKAAMIKKPETKGKVNLSVPVTTK